MPQEVFSILAVCTGNICRSPAVERLLASQLAPSVSVSSAGTHALVGHPISEPMATLLRQAAVEPEPFEARRLSEQMVKESDLILAMTRAQRGLVVELWPAAVRRTFTLREFARLFELGRSICLAGRIARRATESSDSSGRCRARQGADVARRGRRCRSVSTQQRGVCRLVHADLVSRGVHRLCNRYKRTNLSPALYNGLVK